MEYEKREFGTNNILLVSRQTVSKSILTQDFLDWLTPAELNEFNELKLFKRKEEFLAVRFMLYQVGLKGKLIYDQFGAPSVSDKSFFISISHSKDWIGIALNKMEPVGFDLEAVREKILRLYVKFAHPLEFDFFNPTEPIQSTLLWSFKETVFKLMRRQGVQFDSAIQVYPINESTYEAVFLHADEKYLVTLGFEFMDNHVLTYSLRDAKKC